MVVDNKQTKSKNKISLMGIIFSILFLAAFYQPESFMDMFIIAKYYYIILVSLLLISVSAIFYTTYKFKSKITLNYIDITILLYFSYSLIHYIIKSGNPFFDIKFLDFFIPVVVYFLTKPFFDSNHAINQNNRFIKTVFGILMFIGIIQSMAGILQYFDLIKKAQNEFNIPGFYGNPGPFANFLSCILPVSLSLAFFEKKSFLKRIAIVSSIAIIIVLPLTNARTSWIAAFIVFVFVVSQTDHFMMFWKKHFTMLLNRILLWCFVAIVFVSGFWFLHQYKQESSSGRVFIWKIAGQMIAQKPVFGCGFGKYNAEHNAFQVKYFKENATDFVNANLADNSKFAFNEFIQITAETGILGVLFFLSIFYFSFRNFKEKTQIEKINTVSAIGILISIIIGSLFSYPLQTTPILMLFITALAILSNVGLEVKHEIYINKKTRNSLAYVVVGLSIIFSGYVFKRIDAEKKWKKAFALVRNKQYNEAKKEYASLYPLLKHNPNFLFNYGAELTLMQEYNKSIEILKQIEHRLTSVDYYNYLGNSYEGTGDLKNALESFKTAATMVPVKFYPRYRMLVIYDKLGDYKSALELARETINMPVKIESAIVYEIKDKMKEYIAKNSDKI